MPKICWQKEIKAVTDKSSVSAFNRQSIAVINTLIEVHSKEVAWRLNRLRTSIESLPSQTVTTMPVSYEKKPREEGPSTRSLQEIADLALQAAHHRQEMDKLTRTKLQLFDDCDFPGGDELRRRIEAHKAAIP